MQGRDTVKIMSIDIFSRFFYHFCPLITFGLVAIVFVIFIVLLIELFFCDLFYSDNNGFSVKSVNLDDSCPDENEHVCRNDWCRKQWKGKFMTTRRNVNDIEIIFNTSKIEDIRIVIGLEKKNVNDVVSSQLKTLK